MTRVLVTGATGNVGTAVVDALVDDPQVTEVVGVARRPVESPTERLRYVAGDIGREDLAEHLAGIDAVVHLAWMFQPTHRPEVTWRANAIGTSTLLDAAARAGVGAVVVASSVGAYSPVSDPAQRVDESWPTHSLPTAGYGREKAYVERVLDAFEREHPAVRVVRMRPAVIFQRAAASEQRRIFAGPFVPGSLVRRGLVPVLPWPAGLSLQTLHTDDVAQAFRLAVVGEARGAFNLAAEPVIDGDVFGEVLSARPVRVPGSAARAVLAALWRLHLVPAEPALLDLLMGLPLMDTTRAREELGWAPRRSSVEALQEFLTGLREGSGGSTPPLAADSPAGRAREVSSGVGEHNLAPGDVPGDS